MARTTRLYIQVNGKYQEVDLFDNIVIPLTLKVTDIRTFGSKTSGYSLDFEIPNTSNNAILFGLNSEIDAYESTFEVEKDYPAYVTDNTLTTFTGQFRLKKVIKKNNGAYIYYVGYMYGGSKTLVDNMGTDKLVGNDDPTRDISFSEYTAPASEMTLQDIYYLLQTKYSDGTGWGLTLIDKTNKAAQAFSGGSQTWYTDECTPYLYAREIFDRLFAGTGYTYVSEFMQGTDFSTYLQDPRWANTIGKYDVNSIIYPYMKHNSNIRALNPVSASVFQINANATSVMFRDSIPSSYPWGEYVSLNGSNNAYTVNFDSNDYGSADTGVTIPLSSWRFVCPSSGTYNINISYPFRLRTQFYKDFYSELYVNRATNNDTTQKFTYWMAIQKNNIPLAEIAQQQNYPEHYTVDANGWTELVGEQTITYNNTIRLNAGDSIQIYCAFQMQWYREVWWESTGEWIKIYAFRTNETIDTALRPINISFECLPKQNDDIITITQNDGFYEENAFDPTAILNPKTTKLEFFSNFVKMFNLYVEDVSGKTNYKTGGIYPPNTLRIEPYEIFYNPELGSGQSNVKDWTNKIDFSTVEYRRCDDYLFNIQSFTKKQDKDFYNDNYDSTYVTPYGNREVKGVYCTSDSRNEIGLNVSANLCGIVNNATDVLQCPKVFALDKSGNIDTKKEYSDGMFFLWRNYMSANTSLSTNYTLKLQSRIHSGSGSYYNMTDYYCADTLNKGYGQDDANLNWGGTETYYQNMKGTLPTYNDLYSAFYSKEYEEKTAPDCRIMKANAFLTPLDIYTLQLSDMIIVNGNTFHILSIEQWKDEKTPCVVELIKTKPNYSQASRTDKPFPVIVSPVLPIALDNSALLEQLERANEEIASLEDEISEIRNEYRIPLSIVFNGNDSTERKVVNTKVSEAVYDAMRIGKWDTSTVTRHDSRATITLDKDKTVTPIITTETSARLDYETQLQNATAQAQHKWSDIEKWNSIPAKKKGTNDLKAKRGMYSASWLYTYG